MRTNCRWRLGAEEKVKALNKHLVRPSIQLQLELGSNDGTEHQSDSDAAAEINVLTLEGITQKTTLGLQIMISNLAALRTQASVITRLSLPGKEADLRAFRS
jgi:hypothetical protein